MNDLQAEVYLTLTKSEALVLFEFLAQADTDGPMPPVDAATQQVLWHIEGQLERTLAEPLASNYAEILADARKRVTDGAGER